jgi:hypothetical protein
VESPIAISHRTSRVLTCWYQALLVLVWYRRREEMAVPTAGFGLSGAATAVGGSYSREKTHCCIATHHDQVGLGEIRRVRPAISHGACGGAGPAAGRGAAGRGRGALNATGLTRRDPRWH